MAGESKTAIVAAFLGNAALALLKGVAAAVTGSAAMLAETFHSIADTGNQALLFLGLRLGARPPDRVHPFGYGKEIYFWAFVVSVMLFSLGGAFSIWEAVRKILRPGVHEASPWWSFAVLGGGLIFEATSFGVAIHSLRQARGRRSLRQYWAETRDPTLITVVAEDSAAMISLLVAGAGIAGTLVTRDPFWDALASGLIGLVLVAVAVVLAFENHSLIIGEAAPPRIERKIREAVLADEAVEDVAALHTMHLGPHLILAVVGVVFRGELATPRIETAVARLHGRVKAAIGGDTRAQLIVIEPAPRDGAAVRTAA